MMPLCYHMRHFLAIQLIISPRAISFSFLVKARPHPRFLTWCFSSMRRSLLPEKHHVKKRGFAHGKKAPCGSVYENGKASARGAATDVLVMSHPSFLGNPVCPCARPRPLVFQWLCRSGAPRQTCTTTAFFLGWGGLASFPCFCKSRDDS